MKRTTKTIILKIVGNLDPEGLSHHDLKPLSCGQIDELLKLADKSVVDRICEATESLAAAPPDEIVDYVAEHSRTLLNYLAVRAMLCGEEPCDDDDDYDDLLGELGIL